MESQHLLTLLLRVAVAASLASILSRFSAFQLMLMREDRTLVQRVKLALMFWAMYGGSVLFRVLNQVKYDAVDLGLEGSLLSGMVGGYVTGLLSGILISIPAVAHREPTTMLLFAGVGVLGGLLRDLAPEKEDIWRFSPIFSLNPRRLRQRPYQLRLLFQVGCLFSVIFSGLLRVELKTLPLKDGHGAGCVRQHGVRRDDPAQNLEQHAQRKEAGSAAVAFERSAPGRPHQPN
jgi:hypothetical protein